MTDINKQDQIRKQAMFDYQAREEAKTRLINQISAGNIDPLNWLKTNFKYTAIPANAKYSIACSRQMSTALQSPTAVFTYGLDAKAIDKLMLSGNQAAFIEATTNPKKMPHSPNDAKVYAAASSFKSFYSTRKFKNLGTIDAITFISPDENIKAVFLWFNFYRGMEKLSACQTLPLGPTIEIHIKDKTSGYTENSYQPDDLELALEKAQMSTDEYYGLKMKMLQAKADANDSEFLNTNTSYPAGNYDNYEIINEMLQTIRLRKMNANLYKKYTYILDPLLNY